MRTQSRLAIVQLIWILLAVAAGACPEAGFGQGSSHEEDETQLLALENAWNQAELHNDPAALKLLLTDDFIITEPDGELMTKGQLMATTADSSYHYDVLVSEGYRVRVYGTVAVVTGTYHEKGSAKGKHFDRRGRFTDTWLKFGVGWQCVASHDSVAVKE
jgi:ketosteroid isomerase-like protein